MGHRPSSSALPQTKQYAFGPGTIGAGPSSFGAGSGSGGGVVAGRAGSVAVGLVGLVGPAGAAGVGSVGADGFAGFSGSDGDGAPTGSPVAAAGEAVASDSSDVESGFGEGFADPASFFAGGGSSFFFRRKNDIDPLDEERRLRSVARTEVTVFRDTRYRGSWQPPPPND